MLPLAPTVIPFAQTPLLSILEAHAQRVLALESSGGSMDPPGEPTLVSNAADLPDSATGTASTLPGPQRLDLSLSDGTEAAVSSPIGPPGDSGSD